MMFGKMVECGKEIKDVIIKNERKGEEIEMKDIIER